jgi:hypothetical protein
MPAKKTASAKKASAKKAVAKKGAAMRRADLGAPIDGFFGKQPSHLRAVLETLRGMIEDVAPDATSSLKWGMPFYMIGRANYCAIAGHKSHVNLILAGPPGTFADPGGLLVGDGKTGKHLKLRGVEEIPRDAVRGWLHAASRLARANAS